MNDIKEITNNSITFVPTFVKNILTKGVTKSIAEQVVVLRKCKKRNDRCHRTRRRSSRTCKKTNAFKQGITKKFDISFRKHFL